MTLLAAPANRIGLTLCLCLALIAGLMRQPVPATAGPGSPSFASMAANMLSAMNSERAKHGLAPLRMDSRLILSAHRHNLWMARANQVSHQLPGELVFSARITKAGYTWRAAAENIGRTPSATMLGLYAQQRAMYNEVAPNDGHRVNILSRTYRQAGIDIYIDPPTRNLWFTQDLALA